MKKVEFDLLSHEVLYKMLIEGISISNTEIIRNIFVVTEDSEKRSFLHKAVLDNNIRAIKILIDELSSNKDLTEDYCFFDDELYDEISKEYDPEGYKKIDPDNNLICEAIKYCSFSTIKFLIDSLKIRDGGRKELKAALSRLNDEEGFDILEVLLLEGANVEGFSLLEKYKITLEKLNDQNINISKERRRQILYELLNE